MAWDWLDNHLSDSERGEYLSRMVRVVDLVLEAKPKIDRENLSGFPGGFYGVRNCLWFIGCTGFQTGIETEKVNEWLVWGRTENLKMLEHRRQASGDDGGGASATLGYVLEAYPWAEQNFFYTWLSSTGQNLAPDWPHSAWLANYVLWQWITAEPDPLEFGYGDTPHTSNRLPLHELFTHLANLQHFYRRTAPEASSVARYVQGLLPQKKSSTWFIYPFLWSDAEKPTEYFVPRNLPKARHFETMGQVVMRSGWGKEDTYCLFACGGPLFQHRHYDALSFVLYHRGFLALDSGTRHDQFVNGQHLANYYAQTVAHNCVVIHRPDEPPAPYWGGTVVGNHGGQHRSVGSVVRAFETRDDYVYVAGDATACYQRGASKGRTGAAFEEKTTQVVRQLVFLPPHHFVIFDRVSSTDPSYRKDWLLHTAHEPLIQGQTFRADHGEGRMFCRTVLPADARLAKIGGPGKEFWAAGTNWSIRSDGLQPAALALMGQWRVEVRVGPVSYTHLDVYKRQLHDMALSDVRFWGQGTWSDNTLCKWPDVKSVHPMVGSRVGFLGCYFNDAGVNPMHDEFFAPMSSEASAILRVAKEEAPDCAVSLHSHDYAPEVLRPAYVPLEAQEQVRRLAERYSKRLAGLGLPHKAPFQAEPAQGNPPPPFNLTSALYHVSGATTFTLECPHGLREERSCRVSPDQILDIQLALYECMMSHFLELHTKEPTE